MALYEVSFSKSVMGEIGIKKSILSLKKLRTHFNLEMLVILIFIIPINVLLRWSFQKSSNL